MSEVDINTGKYKIMFYYRSMIKYFENKSIEQNLLKLFIKVQWSYRKSDKIQTK